MNKITSSAVSESAQGQTVKPPPEAATRWRKLLADQRVSGLPVSVFCRERGIAQSSLFAWRRKLAGLGVGQETFKAVKVMTKAAPLRPRRPSGRPTASLRDGTRKQTYESILIKAKMRPAHGEHLRWRTSSGGSSSYASRFEHKRV